MPMPMPMPMAPISVPPRPPPHHHHQRPDTVTCPQPIIDSQNAAATAVDGEVEQEQQPQQLLESPTTASIRTSTMPPRSPLRIPRPPLSCACRAAVTPCHPSNDSAASAATITIISHFQKQIVTPASRSLSLPLSLPLSCRQPHPHRSASRCRSLSCRPTHMMGSVCTLIFVAILPLFSTLFPLHLPLLLLPCHGQTPSDCQQCCFQLPRPASCDRQCRCVAPVIPPEGGLGDYGDFDRSSMSTG